MFQGYSLRHCLSLVYFNVKASKAHKHNSNQCNKTPTTEQKITKEAKEMVSKWYTKEH